MAHDIAIITIPKHGVNVPPLALPYLAGAIKAAGFTSIIKDFNIELYEKTIHSSWANIWSETDMTLYREPDFSSFLDLFYEPILDQWAEEISNYDVKWLGISCFSYRSIPTLKRLIPKIRSRNSRQLIIVGGAPMSFYGTEIIKDGLADRVILSEGEVALVELIKGNENYPGILSPSQMKSNPLQILDLNELPSPNYTGIDFKKYTPGDPGGLIALEENYDRFGQQAGLMASRGCVRNCSFCDVEYFWPKFRWRSAENIFSEMKSLWDKYGVCEIYFHDSLINGSTRSLIDLLNILIKNRKSYPFKLRGLSIIRPQPEKIYDLLERAGFVQLQIGIESFSERTRKHMKKEFSNELLLENLEGYAKTNLKIVLLLMAGYPTENEKDHEDNLKWLRDHLRFNQNPIWRLDWGGTALILPGSPLFSDSQFSFTWDENNDWIYQNGTEINDMKTRVSRLRQAEKEARQLGWRVGSSYAGGQMVIGDIEKATLKTQPSKEGSQKSAKQAVGWQQNPQRATIGYKDVKI